MRMLILTVGLLFAFTGCTLFKSAACDVSKNISATVGPIVAAKLSCSNPANVTTWIQAQLDKTTVCDKASAVKGVSGIGTIVCPLAADTIIAGLAGTIPSDWGCSSTGGDVGAALRDQIVTACQGVIK